LNNVIPVNENIIFAVLAMLAFRRLARITEGSRFGSGRDNTTQKRKV
jgi:hypothetical protein